MYRIQTPQAPIVQNRNQAEYKMDEYNKYAPEGKFGHYIIMAEAIGGVDCRAKGRQFGDYENATGTGQVHLWFDQPVEGWT